MNITIKSYYELHSKNCSLVLDCSSQAPAIMYWGAKLSKNTSPKMLALLNTRQEKQGCVAKEAPITLSPEFGAGFLGNAGIQAHSQGRRWAILLQLTNAIHDESNNRLIFESRCTISQVAVKHTLTLDHDSDLLTATTELTNAGTEPLSVEQCNAPSIPIPQHFDQILGFHGRWANEFQTQHIERFVGSYVRESRAGRTSHENFPGVVIHTQQTNEQTGGAYGLHLGWSGNHRINVEERSDGRSFAQLGELLYPGELCLKPGQSYCSPVLYGVRTEQGFTGMSQGFHRYVRTHLTDERVRNKLKPVHFNTWEAMYFDLDLKRLSDLVDQAADIGVERFVLDDGWFPGRDSDAAGLGDWYVDKTKFPEGLMPLINHVHSKGMQFGLWVEPEMVNPDSDLYRAHPDWVLNADPLPKVMFRHQLVLDLTRADVQTYLFERIDALLAEHPISYLKWDMNRDLNQPGDGSKKVAVHNQTNALYALIERLRRAHPSVEIESCASGGARADFGILQHTDRVWTSDTNDAIDRLRVQKGFSYFFPAEFMGAHVGPYHCHITGRTISMAMRAGVAMFGDMGVEANILEISPADKQELTKAIALHKEHRKLIFTGDLVRLDMDKSENGFGIVAHDQTEALFSYAALETQPRSVPGKLMFKGLANNSEYKIKLAWPEQPLRYSDSILEVIDGAVISGEALMNLGMQLPLMWPESLLVFHLKQVN